MNNIKDKKLFQKCYEFTRADDIKARGVYPYFRAIEESEGPVVQMGGKQVIMAGSNNYLGLAAHPKVKEAAAAALKKYGTSCSGSRYLTGTIDLHEKLEKELAEYMGKEAALIMSTGYQTGQGVIEPLVGRDDYIISDKDNHASIVAGNFMARGKGAKVIRYKHNDTDDLERRLKKIPLDAGKLIVTDGVFSTFGDIAPLAKIQKLAKTYQAQILVDDAHGIGVVGQKGRGAANHFGLDKDIDLIVCTFSKTFASLGGFVAGEERVINYLKHHSPAFIFSASPTPPSVAAAYAALQILKSEPERVDRLYHNSSTIRNGLQSLGFKVMDGISAIVPVIIGDDEIAFNFWTQLFDAGIFVNVFISPATPPKMAMLRNSFMATHQDEHLEQILDVYEKVGRNLGVI